MDASDEKSGSSGRRLFVNNLAWQVSWQDLKDLFNTVGTVVYADVKKYFDGRSKGWGVVEYETTEEALKAIEQLNQTDMNGRNIYVRMDREDFETNPNAGQNRQFRQQQARPFNNGGGGVGGRRGGGGGGGEGCSVYVSNLHPSVRWQDLKDLFRTAGDVMHADVHASNSGKAYGVIQYSNPEDAQNCIQTMDRAMLKGQPVFVREDRQAGNNDDTGGGGGGGRRGGGGGGGGFDQAGQPTGGGTQIVVFGLPYSYGSEELGDLFAKLNPVQAEVAVSGSGSSKGFGTVQFGTPDEAAAAIQAWDQQMVEGRSLSVRMDKFGM